MSSLESAVRDAVVRIGAFEDGYDRRIPAFWGSGFFIAPGWVLTSAHVVGQGGGAVWRGEHAVGVTTAAGKRMAGALVCGLPAPEDPDRPPAAWSSPDLALVRVPEAVDTDCLWLSDRSATGQAEIGLYGYTPDPLGGAEEFVPVAGRSSGTGGGVLMLQCQYLPAGCSGGPVLDRGRGSVIGVVKGRARQAKDSARATAVTAARAFWEAGPAAAAAWHEALAAHDRHHVDRYRTSPESWPREQVELEMRRGRNAGGFTADQRVELYGRFAELPPPGNSGEVMDLVTTTLYDVLRLPDRIDVQAPGSWREGVGMLYGPQDGRPSSDSGTPWELEREAVVLFAARAYAALRARPAVPAPRAGAQARPGPLEALRRWAQDASMSLRNQVIRQKVTDVLGSTGPATAGATAARPGSAYADVLVEIDPDLYGAHAWRVKLVHRDGQITPLCNNEVGVPRAELEHDVRRALADALDRADVGEHLAAVDFVLPRAMFDEPVDTWRAREPVAGEEFSAHTLPLGRRRAVALRDRHRGLRPPTPEWHRRWAGLRAGPPAAVPLCGETRDHGHGGEEEHRDVTYGRLHESSACSVPVHCARVGSGRAASALGAALAAGHPVVLWRRCDEGHDDCAAFYDRVAELLAGVEPDVNLPHRVRAVRNQAAGAGVPGSGTWAADLVLLYDPPHASAVFDGLLREPQQ